MKIKKFEKTRYTDSIKVSNLIFQEKIETGLNGDDFIKDTLTSRLNLYFYSRVEEEKEITIRTPRPKFLDWFLRRDKRHFFTVKATEILQSPKSTDHRIITVFDIDAK